MKTKKEIPFEKQTKAQKRVTIAKDVLAQLASKRLMAMQGVYLDQVINAKKLDAEVCTVTKKQKRCDVCALGGMFIVAVERANHLKIRDLGGVIGNEATLSWDDCTEYLSRFFDEEQLHEIEAAFEQFGIARNFAANANDPNTRMRLIMENIVANKGRFVPEREPVLEYVTPGY